MHRYDTYIIYYNYTISVYIYYFMHTTTTIRVPCAVGGRLRKRAPPAESPAAHDYLINNSL